MIPLLLLFSQARNVYLAMFLAIGIGTCVQTAYSPMVGLGQKYLPDHVGFASGMTLGVAVSAGGMFTPILGTIADQRGIAMIMILLPVIAIVPMVVSFTLPSVEVRKELAEQNA